MYYCCLEFYIVNYSLSIITIIITLLVLLSSLLLDVFLVFIFF